MAFDRPGNPADLNPDPLLNLTDAAAYLTVSPRWLKDAYLAGSPVPTRLGRNIRFRVSELERFLSERTRTAGTQDRA